MKQSKPQPRQSTYKRKENVIKQLTRRTATSLLFVALLLVLLSAGAAWAQDKKPNIVVIWGDDTGRSNISAYTHGVMGYRTPNIDRIAHEGMFFTDYYTENSCRNPALRVVTTCCPSSTSSRRTPAMTSIS